MQEKRVWSLGQEKEMATHSSNLAWKIPWKEEPGGLHSMGSQELNMTERLNNNNTCKYLSEWLNHLQQAIASLYAIVYEKWKVILFPENLSER